MWQMCRHDERIEQWTCKDFVLNKREYVAGPALDSPGAFRFRFPNRRHARKGKAVLRCVLVLQVLQYRNFARSRNRWN